MADRFVTVGRFLNETEAHMARARIDAVVALCGALPIVSHQPVTCICRDCGHRWLRDPNNG